MLPSEPHAICLLALETRVRIALAICAAIPAPIEARRSDFVASHAPFGHKPLEVSALSICNCCAIFWRHVPLHNQPPGVMANSRSKLSKGVPNRTLASIMMIAVAKVISRAVDIRSEMVIIAGRSCGSRLSATALMPMRAASA